MSIIARRLYLVLLIKFAINALINPLKPKGRYSGPTNIIPVTKTQKAGIPA